MKTLKLILNILVTITFFSLLGWGLYWGVQFAENLFGEFTAQQSFSYTFLGIIGIFCTFVLAWSIYSRGNNSYTKVIPERIETYNMLVEFLAEYKQILNELSPEDFKHEAGFLKQKLVLWSSDRVLNLFCGWEKLCQELGADHSATLHQGERVFRQIRKEISRANNYVKPGQINEMLGLFPHQEQADAKLNEVKTKAFFEPSNSNSY